MKIKKIINISSYLIAALIFFSASSVLAEPTSGAYVTDETKSYVQDATNQGADLPNMVLRYLNAIGGTLTDVVNKGDYVALVDKNKCDSRTSLSQSASGNSGSTSAPKYMRAIVNSSRADNNSPLIGKAWFYEDEMAKWNSDGSYGGGDKGVNYCRVSATASATATSPYGVFHVDFCGLRNDAGSTCDEANASFRGYVEGNGAAITAWAVNSFYSKYYNSVYLTGVIDSGNGRIKFTPENGTSGDWKFAYNSNYFRRADNEVGANDTCFDRSFANAEKTAWRYGVYTSSGARVDRNSGFPIKVDGQYGYVGYWGLSLPSGVTLADGATVTRFSYDNNQANEESYTLVKKEGRLKKLTRKQTTLDAIKNLSISFWDGAGKEIKWDGAKLVVTATVNNGKVTPATEPYSEVATENTWNIYGWSQSLGGQVIIVTRNADGSSALPLTVATVVNYVAETVLTPGSADWPTGSLTCITDCPQTGTTFTNGLGTDGNPFKDIIVYNGSVKSQTSRWNWSPVATGTAPQYTASASTGLLEIIGSAVAWSSSSAPGNTQFTYGFQSGRLVDTSDTSALNDIKCDANGMNAGEKTYYCPNRLDSLTTTYVWETGHNSWNKFAGLKSGATYVNFEAPLFLTYDATSVSSTFKSMVLQYNSFGNLSGIPGKCVSPVDNLPKACTNDNATRWVAAFTIPAGSTVTDASGTTYYVKPLEQELRLSKVAASNCISLTLPTVANDSMPTASNWTNPQSIIGAAPTVTTAPKVIQGVLQY